MNESVACREKADGNWRLSVSARSSEAADSNLKKETHVRLTDAYFSEEKLNALFDTLSRPAQEALLLRYLDLAQAQTALNLNNSQLLAEVSRQACVYEQTREFGFECLEKKRCAGNL